MNRIVGYIRDKSNPMTGAGVLVSGCGDLRRRIERSYLQRKIVYKNIIDSCKNGYFTSIGIVTYLDIIHRIGAQVRIPFCYKIGVRPVNKGIEPVNPRSLDA